VKCGFAALVSIAGLATGCFGGSSATPAASGPAAPSPVVSRMLVISRSHRAADVSGGTGRERALLRRVVDRSGVTAVVAAHLGGPSGGFHQPGLWLRLTVAVPNPNKAQAVPSLWQGELVEGAYRAASARAGLPDLAGVVYERRLPTGRIIPWGAGVAGGNAPTRADPRAAVTATAITDRYAAAARAAGWRLRRITLYRPDGLAAAVTLVAAHPRGFDRQLARFERHARLLGTAGTLIEVQNPCGATVYREASARWVGMYANSANPRWLCPNPGASLPTPCPAPAARAC
jgi:hypothetical protein